jgi:hypothetical protein
LVHSFWDYVQAEHLGVEHTVEQNFLPHGSQEAKRQKWHHTLSDHFQVDPSSKLLPAPNSPLDYEFITGLIHHEDRVLMSQPPPNSPPVNTAALAFNI